MEMLLRANGLVGAVGAVTHTHTHTHTHTNATGGLKNVVGMEEEAAEEAEDMNEEVDSNTLHTHMSVCSATNSRKSSVW